MKKLVLVLLLLASADYAFAQCPGANCYVDDTGAGNVYSEASPGKLEELVDCSNGLVPHPGDTIWVRAGTYDAGISSNRSKYFMNGPCTGKDGQPIRIRRYLDERAHFRCGFDISSASFGSTDCVGVNPSNDEATVNITGSAVTRVSGATFITGTPWQNRAVTIDPVDPDGAGPLPDPAPFAATIATVPSTTTMTLTASVSGGPYTNAKITNVASREYIEIWGLELDHGTSTQTRFGSVGHVEVTAGSREVTWVDGANDFSGGINPTATVTTNSVGNLVTWTGGEKFCRSLTGCQGGVGHEWPGKDIIIAGTTYVVDTVSNIPAGCTTACTELTLTTSPGPGIIAGRNARVPYRWSSEDWLINTAGAQDSGGTPTSYITSWCDDANTCWLRTPVTNGVGTNQYESRFATESTIGDSPNTQNGIGIACNGCKFINNYLFDWDGGTLFGGDAFAGKVTIYGNVMWYGGFVGKTRGAGHGFYLQNPPNYGEAARSRFGGNLVGRPFCIMGQLYSESELLSYMTLDDNIFMSNGHGNYPQATWSASGQTCSSGGIWVGATTGGLGTNCAGVPGPNANLKVAKANVLDRNVYYNPTAATYIWGSNKGSCDNTITDNYFISIGTPAFTNGGTFGFQINTGNVYMATGIPTAAGTGSGGPGGAKFNRTDYSGNTYLEAVPVVDVTSVNCKSPMVLSGGDCIFYEPNEYEARKGFASVFNPDGDSTVTVDLCQFGGETGMSWDLFNAQCADPFNVACTPIATSATNDIPNKLSPITSCPWVVTVSATLAAGSIKQPAFTDKNGSTVFPKPPDVGPTFVAFSLERDFAAVVGTATPTPSNTPSPTLTPTPTRTPTFTPSLTPSLTRTPTPTRTGTVPPTSTSSATPTFTPTLTVSNTPTVTATPSGGGAGAAINPINCNVISPMASGVTSEFPGTYMSSSDGNDGMIECPFTVPVAATYYLWAKTHEDSSTEDSFFFTMDDSDLSSTCNLTEDTTCTQIFDTASSKDPFDNCAISTSWGTTSWKKWNNRAGSDGTCSGEGARYSVVLAAGAHTLRVRQRDADTQILYIQVNSDPNFEPEDPQPTPTPGVRGHKHNCPGYRLYHSHDYTQAHQHAGPCTWGY